MSKLLSLYGLKFNPFRPDVPPEALYTTPAVDSFVRRIELGIADGGFGMLTGDPGTGKSIALRLLAERLRALPDVLVGTVEHPQSRTMDFTASSATSSPCRSRPTIVGRASRPCALAGPITSAPAAAAPSSSSTRPKKPSPPCSVSCAFWPAKSSIPNNCFASSSPVMPACPSAFAHPSSCPSAPESDGVWPSTTPPATSCSPASITCSPPPETSRS
jgi:hypothetical protein